jgi:hypothetical protein
MRIGELMRAVTVLARIFLMCLVLSGHGCESGPAAMPGPSGDDEGRKQDFLCDFYGPVKIDIMPLTEVVYGGDDEEASGIKVYVSLLDGFDCQIKGPGVFRVELYEYIQRSAEPKGKRIEIWPDIDLTEPGENNEYWQDFLRAYAFDLDFSSRGKRSYILQVTCICVSGRRLSAEFTLKRPK